MRRCSIQGNGQADASGLTEQISAHESRSRQPVLAGEWAAFWVGSDLEQDMLAPVAIG